MNWGAWIRTAVVVSSIDDAANRIAPNAKPQRQAHTPSVSRAASQLTFGCLLDIVAIVVVAVVFPDSTFKTDAGIFLLLGAPIVLIVGVVVAMGRRDKRSRIGQIGTGTAVGFLGDDNRIHQDPEIFQRTFTGTIERSLKCRRTLSLQGQPLTASVARSLPSEMIWLTEGQQLDRLIDTGELYEDGSPIMPLVTLSNWHKASAREALRSVSSTAPKA